MRHITRVVLAGIVLWGLAAVNAEARQEKNLYDKLSHQASVKARVALFEDATADKKTDAGDLKSNIEKALSERKSIKFEIVNDNAAADITIEGKITELVWSDQDPVDMIAGLGAVAMDAAMVEHYCSLTADVSVTDSKTGHALWKDTVRATVTTNDMTKENFGSFIYKDFAKVFIKEAFSASKK